MTDNWNTNFDQDIFDDERVLGGAEDYTPIKVSIANKAGDDEQSYRKITDHDDFAPVIISPATQTIYYMVREGWVYDIAYIVAATFTAGSVSVYKNFIADEQLKFTFSSAGIFQWSKGQLPLRMGDQLIFVANGVTGNVTVSMSGKMVRREFWGEYII
jgi:hypothetical protein